MTERDVLTMPSSVSGPCGEKGRQIWRKSAAFWQPGST